MILQGWCGNKKKLLCYKENRTAKQQHFFLKKGQGLSSKTEVHL